MGVRYLPTVRRQEALRSHRRQVPHVVGHVAARKAILPLETPQHLTTIAWRQVKPSANV